MWLRKAADFIDRGLSPLTTVVGKIGSSVIALMMLLTVSDVVGRRLFKQAVLGAYELNEIMLVIVVFFTLSYVEVLRRHISIGLVVDRLKQKTQDIIDSIMYVLFLGLFCVLTWQLCIYAVEVHQNEQVVSVTLGAPVLPFVAFAAFGSFLLSLVVLMRLLLFLAGAIKRCP